MRRGILSGLAAIVAAAALAATLAAQNGPRSKPTPGETKVRISPEDCERLVRHVARSDVSFKPGVDVRGRPVAPADLPGSTSAYQAPEFYEFVVAINPLDGTDFTETVLPLGVVQFDVKTNRLTFNGQPLSDRYQEQLAEQCRRIRSGQ